MSQTDRSGHTTTDHAFIRRWVEERGGRPTHVKGTGGADDPGVLRIDFPDTESEALEEIAWTDFFEKFEESKLAFLHRDIMGDDGKPDRFNKFVSRDS